ncbi:hypothetical protein [Trichothermofontia sp.]
MSETEKQNLKDLEGKLQAFLACILKKAESDIEFRQEIGIALQGDFSAKNPSSRISKSRSKKNTFNAVDYLHEHNVSLLREELETKTDTELKQILQANSNKKAKDLKKIEREQLIDEIVENANRVLNQGSSFLQISDTVEMPAKSSEVTD